MTSRTFAVANATAVTTFILWALCAVVYLLAPQLYFSTVSSWVHGMDVSPLMTRSITLPGFLWGGVSLSAFGWAVGFVFYSALTMFAKKK